jgi:hypothetical protein
LKPLDHDDPRSLALSGSGFPVPQASNLDVAGPVPNRQITASNVSPNAADHTNGFGVVPVGAIEAGGQ